MSVEPKMFYSVEEAYQCPWCGGDADEEPYVFGNGDGTVTVQYKCNTCYTEADLEFKWNEFEDGPTPYDGKFISGIWWVPDDYPEDE